MPSLVNDYVMSQGEGQSPLSSLQERLLARIMTSQPPAVPLPAPIPATPAPAQASSLPGLDSTALLGQLLSLYGLQPGSSASPTSLRTPPSRSAEAPASSPQWKKADVLANPGAYMTFVDGIIASRGWESQSEARTTVKGTQEAPTKAKADMLRGQAALQMQQAGVNPETINAWLKKGELLEPKLKRELAETQRKEQLALIHQVFNQAITRGGTTPLSTDETKPENRSAVQKKFAWAVIFPDGTGLGVKKGWFDQDKKHPGQVFEYPGSSIDFLQGTVQGGAAPAMSSDVQRATDAQLKARGIQ